MTSALSFGGGIHHCLGAALARLETQVLMPELVRRFPNAQLAAEPVRRSGLTIRGYTSLPVGGRNAEQLADHRNRERECDLIDELDEPGS